MSSIEFVHHFLAVQFVPLVLRNDVLNISQSAVDQSCKYPFQRLYSPAGKTVLSRGVALVNELTVEALQASKVETQQIFIIVYRSLDTPSIMGDGCIVSQCYYYFFLFCNYISYCYILYYSKINTLDHIIMLFSN